MEQQEYRIDETRRGKKPTPISFPSGEFTVEEAFNFNSGKIGKVALQKRINEGILSGLVKSVGTVRISHSGRPRKKFIVIQK